MTFRSDDALPGYPADLDHALSMPGTRICRRGHVATGRNCVRCALLMRKSPQRWERYLAYQRRFYEVAKSA